jgi:NAD-dependent deacetylase
MKRVVVLTGAGVSQESGIMTFRDLGGLWEQVRIEEVASPQAFHAMPERVHEFYNMRRRQLQRPEVQPNVAHVALADFESRWAGGFALITQNVDNLHERAGSRKLLHMHGELLRARCVHCHATCDWPDDLSTETACPACSRRGGMRPDIVWFGETPFFLDEIVELVAGCDLFVAIGTSGVVYPAAGLGQAARAHGATTVEINVEATPSSHFQQRLVGAASEQVPRFFGTLALS